MKKIVLVLTVLAFAVLLVGCKQSGAAQNFGDQVENWRVVDDKSQIEIETYTSPAFGKDLGFDVVSYPNDTELSPYKFFALSKWYGQMEYKLADDRVLVVRVAHAKDHAELSSTYEGLYASSDETREVNGVEVRTRSNNKGSYMATWTRGDFQYLVHSPHQQEPPPQEIFDRLVGELNSADV